VEAYDGSLEQGLQELQRIGQEQTVADAERFAERLLAPGRADRAGAWLERKFAFLGPRSLGISHAVLHAIGLVPRGASEQAVVHYDLGVLQVEAGSVQQAQASFQTAIYLAPGTVREAGTYNLGWLDLKKAEELFDQIPEVHGRTRSAMSPGFVPTQTQGDEEEPDYLKLARTQYESALARFVDRLRLDWRDADTRANVEWIQRRLDELRKIEEKRKSDEGQGMAQDDPSQGDGQNEEKQDDAGEKGAESQESPQDNPQDSQENQPRENEQGQQAQNQDRENDSQDGEQRDQGSESEGDAQEAPEEHTLTEEEIKRLLKRMEQYSKEGERLRDLVQPRPQGRVKKDW